MITLLYSILLWAGVTITLPAQAQVAGAEMSLGAVAKIECDDPVLAAQLQTLALGYVPAPGFSRVLEASAIQRQVRAIAAGVDVRFVGAGTCRVSPQTETISAEAISNAARAALVRHLEERNLGDCTLEPAVAIEAIEVPKGAQSFALEVAPQPAKPNYSPALVAVRLVVDGQIYRTAHTTWRVQAWRQQPVLLSNVRAGELVEAGMLELRRVPIDAALLSSALEPLQVMGTAAIRDLQVGRTLLAGDLVRPIIVRKGDTLILDITRGSVRVRTPVIAASAGAQGDRIRVLVQRSGHEVQAIIESRDTVRLDLGSRQSKGVRQ